MKHTLLALFIGLAPLSAQVEPDLKDLKADLAALLIAQAQPAPPSMAGALAQVDADRRKQQLADRAYRDAQRSLDKKRWEEAYKQFSDIAAQKGERADAAMYWKAYSERKLNQVSAAIATLNALKEAYPSSRWINDAKALEIELAQASGRTVAPETTADEELKLMALNGIMHSDPDRALPILEKMLNGSDSPKLKERALFVLAQSGLPKAREILTQTAKGATNPDLQLMAIRNLAVFGGKQNGQILGDIYQSSTDIQVKRAVVNALMISGDRERLAVLAKSEKLPELRRDAIHQLGVMGDQKALIEMYAIETDTSIKKQIQHGLFVGGGAPALVDIARKESNTDLKKYAVQLLSMMQAKEASEYMLELLNK